MGWGTSEHEGFADEGRADGSWSGGASRWGEPDAVAYQAVCSCGWRSEREHPVPLRPADVPCDARGHSHGPASEAWLAALEAASDACWADWRIEHFDPLLGYEPHTQLIEAADPGGRRHFLDGRPVHAGTTLELLLAGGQWLRGRSEWSYAAGQSPTFHVALGGPAGAERQGELPVVSFRLPPRAVLRWPPR
jgi:hypothetical protein